MERPSSARPYLLRYTPDLPLRMARHAAALRKHAGERLELNSATVDLRVTHGMVDGGST